jgi:hypothetical protein
MNKRRYKRAKAKYFRKRVCFWTLYYNRKKAITYGYGLFLPFKDNNDTYSILRMSDTDAFWYAHKLSVTKKNYSLKYRGYNNSVTFTTTRQ